MSKPINEGTLLRDSGSHQGSAGRPAVARMAGGSAAGPGSPDRTRVLAHELANLLDGALRLIELARRTIASPARSAGDAERALRHLDSARAALVHIASLTRTAPGPPATPNEPDLASAIRSAADVLGPAAMARNVALRIAVEPSVEGASAGQLYGVITNALHNAIEAVGSGGVVEVHARRSAEMVEVEVLDDGPGPPPVGRRVFEPGFTTRPGASGIGLALAHEVVEEMGGTIELVARGLATPGRPGAVLRVRFPDRRGGERAC